MRSCRKKAAQIDKSVYDAIDVQKLWHKMQSRGGFFRFVSIKPLTERIDAFDEFLHRRPGGEIRRTSRKVVRRSEEKRKKS